jgi:hypothetical protein
MIVSIDQFENNSSLKNIILSFGVVKYFKYPSFLVLDIQGVFRKRPTFLNSAPTGTESALQLLSTLSVRF